MKILDWLFGRKATTVVQSFTFTEFPPVEAPQPKADAWDIEMTVPLRTIAGVFAERGWRYSHGDQLITPDARNLAEIIIQMIATIEDDEATYHTLGRFLVIKDADFPGDIDVYLHVGTATPKSEEESDSD